MPKSKVKPKTHKFPGTAARRKKAPVPAAPPVLEFEPSERVRTKFFIPRWARAAAKVIAAERNAAGGNTTMEKTLGDLVSERIGEIRPDLTPSPLVK